MPTTTTSRRFTTDTVDKPSTSGTANATASTLATKGATNEDAPPTARDGSKKAIVLELIRRADGASLKEIADVNEWQAHSIRGFISGSLGKKMGLTIESFKTGRWRTRLPHGCRVELLRNSPGIRQGRLCVAAGRRRKAGRTPLPGRLDI